MNKAQQWLGKQCSIYSKGRVLLRQGNVNCRTKGWTARSKISIFFLFNDILLWTSKKGELQSVNLIKNCNVRPSDSKIYPEKKFHVIFLDNKTRTLIVECNNKEDRDEWYNAIFKAVLEANSVPKEGFFEQRGLESTLGLAVKDSAWVKAEARLKVSKEQKREIDMHYGSSAIREYHTRLNRDDFAGRTSSRDSEATETNTGKQEYEDFDLLAPCREASVPLDCAENSCCSKQSESVLEDTAKLSNVFGDKDDENCEELSTPLQETRILRSSLTPESSSSMYMVQRDYGKTSEEKDLHLVNESPLRTQNLKSKIAREIGRNIDLPTLEKPVSAPTVLRYTCALPRAVEATVSQSMDRIKGRVATAFPRSTSFTIRRLKSV